MLEKEQSSSKCEEEHWDLCPAGALGCVPGSTLDHCVSTRDAPRELALVGSPHGFRVPELILEELPKQNLEELLERT